MAYTAYVPEKYNTEESIYVSSPGNYHLVVTDFDEDGMRLGPKDNNRGDMVALCEILAGPDGLNQEGLIVRIYLSKNTNVAWKVLRFAEAVGLITRQQLDDAKKNGTELIFDLERDAKGKQFFATVETHEYNGKISFRVEGGMYHLTDARCRSPKQWPRCIPMAKKVGVNFSANSSANANTKNSGGSQGQKTATNQRAPSSQGDTQQSSDVELALDGL